MIYDDDNIHEALEKMASKIPKKPSADAIKALKAKIKRSKLPDPPRPKPIVIALGGRRVLRPKN